MALVSKYITTGKAILNAILRGPLVDITIRGIMATIKAVMMEAIFNEAVDAILHVIFKKTTENKTRWQSY